ncbi:ImmA/IrrE family metallo-endopeptidase [Clavibacter tessellarius]
MSSSSSNFDKFSKWAAGLGTPTFRQLENFANLTHVPLGYLFLDNPPIEQVPIPDYRTLGNVGVTQPSADLIDTIHAAQRRQDWYRGFARNQGIEKLKFLGSATLSSSPTVVAEEVRRELAFPLSGRRDYADSDAALRRLIDAVEDLGVLVMVSGIVGGNTRRILDPEEFRGFALSDSHAALIFVNGADSKAAQMFTLVHELAHLWLGESALSDAALASTDQNKHELWANAVAAEVLVPSKSLEREARGDLTAQEIRRLCLLYRVSSLVILRRLFDLRKLSWDDYRSRYADEVNRLRQVKLSKSSSGGNYYNTQPLRISQSFARAVIVDAMEGRTLYRDAFALLGTSKYSTFKGLANKLGVA